MAFCGGDPAMGPCSTSTCWPTTASHYAPCKRPGLPPRLRVRHILKCQAFSQAKHQEPHRVCAIGQWLVSISDMTGHVSGIIWRSFLIGCFKPPTSPPKICHVRATSTADSKLGGRRMISGPMRHQVRHSRRRYQTLVLLPSFFDSNNTITVECHRAFQLTPINRCSPAQNP